MKVLVTGGTGLVGSVLVPKLQQLGYEVVVLTTKKNLVAAAPQLRFVSWNPQEKVLELSELDGVNAVIHLAGSPLSVRWTQRNRKKILDSRVNGSKLLTEAILSVTNPPEVLISASAEGIYKPSTQPVNELAQKDEGFLADVCGQWEKASAGLVGTPTRRVILRFGVVMDRNGGFLKKLDQMMIGLAAIPGNGKQIVSWIHTADLADLIIHALHNKEVNGIYNAANSNAISLGEIVRKIARLKKNILLPFNVPGWLLHLVLGKMSSIILNSHHLDVSRIESTGFTFRRDQIDQELKQFFNQHP